MAQGNGTGERVGPGGATRCARGGAYAFWLRRADPSRLLLCFQGGGGCFDEVTAVLNSMWFDDRIDERDDPDGAGGVLDFRRRENPFRNYSATYIPSCTGDVHTGAEVVRYGSVTVHQKGYHNAPAALSTTYRLFPNADAVFVTGCSAGSVGSAFHSDAIIRAYPRARVTQVGDSLAFVFHRPVSLENWGTHRHFPSWARPSCEDKRWTVEFIRGLASAHPQHTFARINYVSDAEQQRFYSAVGGDPAGFSPRLRAAEQELTRLPNYRSFLVDGSSHCVLDREAFYELSLNGTRVRDWLADLAAGRDVE